jgi:5-methylthioadenosine/S-adenosylhomocysteine deaminase
LLEIYVNLCNDPKQKKRLCVSMDQSDLQLDILITGGTLLTMNQGADIIDNPSIGIHDGKIIFVQEGNSPSEYPPQAKEVIDASDCLILPGLVNTHTHLPMALFRGIADDLPLDVWLNEHIFPAEKRFINRETTHTGALLAIAEMILSGTTTFCDGYFFESAVARAAISAGMRGVVSQGFIDFPAHDTPDPEKNRVVAENFIQKWRGRSPLITPALVCHSPYTCSPTTLQTIKSVARHYGVPFLIHLAETPNEIAIIQERFGKKPVHHLCDLDMLDADTIAAHCIWLDEDELDILARYDVKVSHCPESSMKLAAGVAPLPKMLQRGITVGLGTDGCASNNDLDLFGEMGMCAKLHKVFSSDPTVLHADQVLELATMGGARVLGMTDRIGSILPGKSADIIILNMNQPHLTPLYNPFSQLVYAASGSDVQTSIINGKVVMKDRRLLTIDMEAVMSDAREIAASVVIEGYYRSSGYSNH